MGQASRERGLESETGAHKERSGPVWDRRHSFRVQVPARASVWFKGQLCGHYAVRDVSIGGCSLTGGPQRKLGEQVEVMLHLPHRAGFVLSASVRRVDEHSMGLSFERTPPRAEDCIQDVVVEAIARKRSNDNGRVAIVVEPHHATRHAIVRTLRELGQHAVGVTTALDAVQLLVEYGDRVDTVFVEAASDALPCLEMLEFLANNHPRVRRVMVGGPHDIASSWVAEATGDVHAVIEMPCTPQAMRRCLSRLGCIPFDVHLS